MPDERSPVGGRAEELFLKQRRTITERVDRSFALLLCGQYLACIAAVLWLSPRAWAGAQSWTHIHVWAAIFLGGTITSLPVALAHMRPGEVLTRHVVAVGQMLMSALLIHTTGGRIETHFHVFGSLAFLAFYRDSRVLVTASVVVALDHFFRGVFWPQSVFGTAVVEYWRWLEHTGWVLFEDVFLMVFIQQNLRMLRENSERRADLEQACDVAEQANRAKDDFIAVLSHELRTPLTPSVMLLSDLARNPALDPAAREDIAVIRRNVEVEARLIDDLLDLTRIARGKVELARSSVDIHGTVAHILEMCREEFAAKGVDVTCRFEARNHFVDGDSSRLLQVFWNLVKNALKFTAHGGAVEITTATVDGRIRIDVSDTGIGIPPAIVPQLFQRFQQGGPEVTRQYGGLGLGLWICRTIVEMHGGQVRAMSEGPGRGSRFVVELPATATLASAGELHTSPAQTGPRTRNRVLLVEDHTDTRQTLARLLTRAGYRVITADSLGSALRKIDEEQFDLVISDIGLPDGSGRDLISTLKKRSNGVRAIAISGFGMDSDVRQSLAAGFDVHLTKPIDFDRLKDVMCETGAVGHHRS